ncbi:MAG: branched-chain amino acid transaminase [Acidiferrobacteraceae bacterium]
MHIWLDGVIRREHELSISPWSHTLHYGMGVFEGIRSHDGPLGPVVFRLEDHLRRLRNSAGLLGMRLTWDLPALAAAVLETLRVNGLGEAYIRPLAYYGGGPMALDNRNHQTHVLVAAWRWDADSEESLLRGLRTRISEVRRPSEASTRVQAKAVGNYLNGQLALREALAHGADEAILLDERGNLAEASAANVFLVSNGRLHTPLPECALAGITRDTLMRLACRLGYEVIETHLGREQIYGADEIFLSGTACGVRTVASVDGRPITSRRRPTISDELREVYRALTRGDSAALALLGRQADGWLTEIYALPGKACQREPEAHAGRVR